MTTPAPGPQLWQALRSVQAVYMESANLLLTADGYLGASPLGLQSCTGSTARSYGSASIHKSNEWIPNVVFRFYQSPKLPKSITAFVSLLLCPYGPEKHAQPFTEPLVCAGWVDLIKPPKTWSKQEHFWAAMTSWHATPRNGTFTVWTPDASKTTSASREEGVLALPLVTVTDSQALKDNLLAPLVQALTKRSKMSSPASASL